MSFPEHPSSDRYRQLVGLYRDMHAHGETFLGLSADDTFPGESLLPHADNLQQLFSKYAVSDCLDYGSGKGKQYSAWLVDKRDGGRRYRGLGEYWGIDVSCYDPAYPPYAVLPRRRFDAVLCTDVLEHCAQEDIAWIIAEIFSRARKVVYVAIACYPARKRLPNGENTHVTVKGPEWWTAIIAKVAADYPGPDYVFLFEQDEKGRGDGISLTTRGVETDTFSRSALTFDRTRAKGARWLRKLTRLRGRRRA